MAIALLEMHGLDSILFCPTQVSPFKTASPPIASAEHRMAMLQEGIRGIKEFSTLGWEIEQAGPSYTVDTIRRLKRESAASLFLILGQDQLSQLHAWKDVEELCTLCNPLVASRDENLFSHSHLSECLRSLIVKGATVIPRMDISSRAIRERLKQGRYCGHWVPAPVLDYIKHHQLYL
jgi:nicotinate-nucleotide adenylyltransferase